MKIKKVTALAVMIIITAANIFAEDFSTTETAFRVAFSKTPLRMDYHERSGAWPAFQEKDISFDIEGNEAVVTFSTDEDAESKPDDPRPPLKSGDREPFEFLSYIQDANAFASNAETELIFLEEKNIEGNTYKIYKMNYSYISGDGRSWPMGGELLIDKKTELPYRLSVKYLKAPDDLKSLSFELTFSGRSVEECRIDKVFSVMKGVYIIFQYTLEQTRSFTY